MNHDMMHNVTLSEIITSWSPGWLVITLLLAGAYLAVIGRIRHRFSGSEPVKWYKKVYFFSGLLMLYLGKGSPIAEAGHYFFSMHMFQMAIEYLAVPPLILAGLPDWFVRPLFQKKRFKKAVSFFIRPMIALMMFNFLFSIYHMPLIFDAVMDSFWLHLVYKAVLTFTAFCMWWLVFCPVPEMDRLSDVKKMGYIFANGVLLTPACALIIFSNSLLYQMFMHTPPLFDFLTPINDQQLGGVLMKVFQEIVYIGAIGYIFYQWMKKAQNEDEEDPYETSERARLAFSAAGDYNKV